MPDLFSPLERGTWDLAVELEARMENLTRDLTKATADLEAVEGKERANLNRIQALQRENDKLRDRAREKLVRPMVRTGDGDTSREAEAGNRLVRREQVQQFVAAFREAGGRGLTDEEAHDAVGLQSHTPRVADMKRAGMLEPTGERRATKSGATAHVYRLVNEWKGQTDGIQTAAQGKGTEGNDTGTTGAA